MRNVIFKELEIKNFRCHEHMDFNFYPNRFVFVAGENGSGKSSIIDALVWVLYDVTAKERKGDSVVRKRSGKDCSVKLNFSVDDDEYQICSYRKHRKFRNAKLIFKNGVDITPIDKSSILSFIEHLLVPKDIFKNCLLFSQYIKDNSFTEMSHSQQKDILDKMLNLSMYDEYYLNITNYIKKIENDNSDYIKEENKLSGEKSATEVILKNRTNQLEQMRIEAVNKKNNYIISLNNLKDSISQLKTFSEEDIQSVFDKIQESISSRSIVHERIMNLNNSLSSNLDRLKERLTSKYKLESERLSASTNVDQLTHELKSIDSNILVLKGNKHAKLSEINSRRDSLSLEINKKYECAKSKLVDSIYKYNSDKKAFEIQINDLTKKKMSLLSEIESINEKLSTDCPVCFACGQKIQDSSLTKIINIKSDKQNEVTAIEEEILNYKRKEESLEASLSSENSKLSELKNSFNADKNKLDQEISNQSQTINREFDIELNKLTETRLDIEDKLKNSKAILDSLISELKENIANEGKKESDRLKNSVSNDLHTYNEELNRIQTRVVELQAELNTMKDSNKEKDSKENEFNLLKSDFSAFGNIMKTQLEATKHDIDNIKITLNNVSDRYTNIKNKMLEFNKTIKVLQFWKQAFSDTGIKSLLLDESIPILNQKVSELCTLTDDIRISFDSQQSLKSGDLRNKFSVNVIQTKNLTDDRYDFSGGEGRIVDIFTLLSLRHLLEVNSGIHFNVILLDEILDSLSDKNIEVMSKILRDLSGDHVVVLISHTQRNNLEADEYLYL